MLFRSGNIRLNLAKRQRLPLLKEREFTYDNIKYALTDDLLIERQKMYNQALETAYTSVITRPMQTKELVKSLEKLRETAGKLSDLKFWQEYENQIRRTKLPKPKI